MRHERAFAWRLRWLLECGNTTIREEHIAERLEVPLDRVLALAWAEEYPTSDEIDALADMYGMTREWMLGETGH